MLTIHPVPYAPPLYDMNPRPFSAITDFIFHHTAGSLQQTPTDIDYEHRHLNPPDAMIAYNWVITPIGEVYAGRPILFDSAASFGRNHESVAAVLVGNFQSDDAGFTGNPTPAQIEAAKQLCLAMHVKIPSIARTYGHGQIPALFYGGDSNYATACPGNRMLDLIPEIKQYVLTQLRARKL